MTGAASAWGCRALVWAVLSGLALTQPAHPQIARWKIDFNDPAEAARWRLDPLQRQQADEIHWELVPRNISHPEEGHALQIAATSRLSVETYFSLYREFPPEFHPDPRNDIVLEWDWMIGDTERSDAVTLSSAEFFCFGFLSHTRYTIGWPVLFDPPERWMHHRGVLARDLCPYDPSQSHLPPGIELDLLSPVGQVVKLGSLSVEEWPRGALPPDPLTLPHPAPVPKAPFVELPLDHLLHTTGGALEDLDGDGLPDLLALERRGYAHLYLNDGSGRFSREVTRQAELAVATLGTGAMFLDLDGDRDADLVLTSELAAPRLFENLGGLRFRERPPPSGLPLSFWYGGAADDIDHDGRPDLLFVSPIRPPFLLLRNRGGWDFRRVPFLDRKLPASLEEGNFTASFADFDRDGWPDVFLGREYLLRNVGGRFELQASPWKEPDRAQTEGGIWGDFTGDSALDLFVLRDAGAPTVGPSRLFAGRHGWADVTRSAGLPPLESAKRAVAEDFNNDGYLDLYICQHNRPSYLLLNDGHGHFEDATDRSGMADSGSCDGLVAADLDGDGGMDAVLFRYGAPPAVLFNRLSRGHFLGVVVAGAFPSTDAIGAQVRVLEPGSGRQIAARWVRRGQGFGSVGPIELRFGLGRRPRIDLEVRFPSGNRRLVRNQPADTTVLVREDDGRIWSSVVRRLAEARFPVVRAFRRALFRRPEIALVTVLTGLLNVLVLAPISGRRRTLRYRWWASWGVAMGALATAALGSAPGHGLMGSAPGLWALGCCCGLLLDGTPRIARRWLSNGPGEPGKGGEITPLAEDLVRFAQDFQHSAMEARTLLSIQGRLKNLFVNDRLFLPYLAPLRELADHFGQHSGPRLAQLAALAQAVFPNLPEAAELADRAKRLGILLGPGNRLEPNGLGALGESEASLRTWRAQALPLAEDTEKALVRLLARLKVLCSCDAREAIAEVLESARAGLQEDGIDCILTVPEGDGPVRVVMSRTTLLLVLENLVANARAVLAARERGHIELALERHAKSVTVRCRDNGPGVPPAMREKIFDYGVSTRPGSRGYGLARSREVVGHFGGTLVLEESAEGAVFSLTLEAVDDP